MKVYLVFHNKIGYRGFTPSKKFIRAFRRQRDDSDYTIYKVDDGDDLSKYGIEDNLNDEYEMFTCHGYIVFRDEEEVFSLSVDQYEKDFRNYLDQVVEHSQFIYLDPYEQDCLIKFECIILDMLDFLRSDEYPEEYYSKIFNIGKMIEQIT